LGRVIGRPNKAATRVTIFVLTRDRPKSLLLCLSALNRAISECTGAQITITVVDDSRKPNATRVAVNRIVSATKIAYHGTGEQRHFLRQFDGEQLVQCRKFFRRLGGSRWDLGGVRNYCLLLAGACTGLESIALFVDDDVQMRPRRLGRNTLRQLVQCAANGRIAGSSLDGAPDVSVAERASMTLSAGSNRLSGLSERPFAISGGLMAFDVRRWAHVPFMRVYNEDWIWALCCKCLGAQIQAFDHFATHRPPQLEAPTLGVLRRQQFGEVLCCGIEEAIGENPKASRRCWQQKEYWQRMRKEEAQYLQTFVSLHREVLTPSSMQRKAMRTLDLAIQATGKVSWNRCLRLATSFESYHREWRRLTECAQQRLRH